MAKFVKMKLHAGGDVWFNPEHVVAVLPAANTEAPATMVQVVGGEVAEVEGAAEDVVGALS